MYARTSDKIEIRYSKQVLFNYVYIKLLTLSNFSTGEAEEGTGGGDGGGRGLSRVGVGVRVRSPIKALFLASLLVDMGKLEELLEVYLGPLVMYMVTRSEIDFSPLSPLVINKSPGRESGSHGRRRPPSPRAEFGGYDGRGVPSSRGGVFGGGPPPPYVRHGRAGPTAPGRWTSATWSSIWWRWQGWSW